VSRIGLLFCLACLLLSSPSQAEPLDHLYSTDDIGPNKIPNTGTSHILVVPANVGPIPFSAADLASLQTYFDPDGGPSSFRVKWQVISRGVYDPIPTVVQPVEYPDSCPFPPWTGKTVDDCAFQFNQDELNLILGGGIAEAFVDILGRVRDEQNIDLTQFDVNTKDGPGSDGYFDGVIFITNLGDGVAPPLEELFNETIVASQPGGGGPMLEMGQVALAPPQDHEFGHLFGFIDLYNGPTVAGLMGDPQSGGLCAFSRQQVGWGETVAVDGYGDVDLPPVLESGKILRIGEGKKYMLLENRSGALHLDYETVGAGLYIHSIDESALTPGPLHFFDLSSGDLFFPNEEAPYLTVAMPLDCELEAQKEKACALDSIGDRRLLRHIDGTPYQMGVQIMDVEPDGTMKLNFYDPLVAPPGVGGDDGTGGDSTIPTNAGGGCGCRLGPSRGGFASLLLLLLGFALSRRRQRLP
jgi:hypothetical protein